MPDWFDKLVAFIKLPMKYLWVAALFSGLTLFLPTEMVKELGLDVLLEKYRPWLGALFIFSTCLVVIEIFQIIWKKLKSNRLEAKFNSKLIDHLNDLDPHEKSVLREYFIQNRNTLQLPYDNATISGMLNHGLLHMAGNTGERSLAGMLLPIKINPKIRGLITNHMIDLPESQNPTQADIEWIRDNRPEFTREIAHHNEVFHRSW
mgnify:CR=1 FL=1